MISREIVYLEHIVECIDAITEYKEFYRKNTK
jgi:hypothetical protein